MSVEKGSMEYRIKEVMEERRLSCYAVARDAGLNPGIVKRWHEGKRGLSFDSAEAIVKALGLKLVEVEARRRRR